MKNPIFDKWRTVYQGTVTVNPLDIEPLANGGLRLPAEEREKFRYLPNCEPVDKKEMWQRMKAQEEALLKRAILEDNVYHREWNPHQNAQKTRQK
jgi:hypothetical protein